MLQKNLLYSVYIYVMSLLFKKGKPRVVNTTVISKRELSFVDAKGALQFLSFLL